jgi:hypothetical protein
VSRLDRNTLKELAGVRANLTALQAHHRDLIGVLRDAGLAVGGYLPAPVVDVLLPDGSVYTTDTTAANDDFLVGYTSEIDDEADDTTDDTTDGTTDDTIADANDDTNDEQHMPIPPSTPRPPAPNGLAAFLAAQWPAAAAPLASSNSSELITGADPSGYSPRSAAPSNRVVAGCDAAMKAANLLRAGGLGVVSCGTY